MVAVAKAEDAFLGAAFLFIATSAAESGVEAMMIERLSQPLRFPHVGVQRTVIERVDSLLLGLGVAPDDQLDRGIGRDAVAHRVHVAELPRRIDMQKREGQGRRKEGLASQMKHHRAILAHGIEHDRPRRLGHGLAQDMNALGLEPVEMGNHESWSP